MTDTYWPQVIIEAAEPFKSEDDAQKWAANMKAKAESTGRRDVNVEIHVFTENRGRR